MVDNYANYPSHISKWTDLSMNDPIELLEPGIVYYVRTEYITTKLGNKISRKSVLCGSDKIVVTGKTLIEPDSILRGDLAVINIGKTNIICGNVILRPPDQIYKGHLVHMPMRIGDHIVIEEGSIVQAATVGSYCHIGKKCVIGRRCVLSECCRLLDGTVLPPSTVVPPFCVYGGNPGVFMGRLPESYQEQRIDHTNTYYKQFMAQQRGLKDKKGRARNMGIRRATATSA